MSGSPDGKASGGSSELLCIYDACARALLADSVEIA